METQEPFNTVYIVAACRTAVGSFCGQFKSIPATTLGALTINECLQQSGISCLQISEVIMGQVLTTGQGLNPARHSALEANISVKVPASTVNMGWGSGLRAVYQGYRSIRSGNAKIVMCGGQENVSMAHHFVRIRKNQNNNGSFKIEDTLLTDCLTDGFTGLHIGKSAERVARIYKISRENQDKFAYESQVKAASAVERNYFLPEIVPVMSKITKDEAVKPAITIEQLSQMSALYEKNLKMNPSVTAGNSSGVGDGAAAITLCSEEYRRKRSLKPLAKIAAFVQTGFEISQPSQEFGPADAIKKVITAANWTEEQVDLYEINESFAVHVLAVMKELKVDPKKVNVAGGSIALGDPPGASGARILVTLIYSLQRLMLTKGIAFMWIGEGMSIAVAVEVQN